MSRALRSALAKLDEDDKQVIRANCEFYQVNSGYPSFSDQKRLDAFKEAINRAAFEFLQAKKGQVEWTYAPKHKDPQHDDPDEG